MSHQVDKKKQFSGKYRVRFPREPREQTLLLEGNSGDIPDPHEVVHILYTSRINSEMDQWQELYKIKVNANASHNFSDAVEILLNKPHVVNKRLCGKNILYREHLTHINTLSEEELKRLAERVHCKSISLDIVDIGNFIEEIFSEFDTQPEPELKKLKIISDKGISDYNKDFLVRVAEWLARGTHDLLIAGSRLTAATQ